MKTAEDYEAADVGVYDRPKRIGYTSIECLPELVEQPWDELALNYVHALRPSFIRVTTGFTQDNACKWRVTVFVDDEGFITRITQEVEVGLTGGYEHGHDLDTHRKRDKRR